MGARHPEVERFEAALQRGRFDEVRRNWPRVKAALLESTGDSSGDWMTLADLAHEEKVDRRTMFRRVHGTPFCWKVRPGLYLVDRGRYLAAQAEGRARKTSGSDHRA